MDIPTLMDIKKGSDAFTLHEKRDAMYKVAIFLVDHFWGQPADMADGLGVLLLTWNQAFYRFGPFDYDDLELCIKNNLDVLEAFRPRYIRDYSVFKDGKMIRGLFSDFMRALQVCEGGNKGNKSPVATVKALHLLAPRFFPLWDNQIAVHFNCLYAVSDFPEEEYLTFMKRYKYIVNGIDISEEHWISEDNLLKKVDEYFYAKVTKRWI